MCCCRSGTTTAFNWKISNSRNGVFLDEKRVTETRLRSGCRLRIGEQVLKYEQVDSRVSEVIPGTASKVDTGFKLLVVDAQAVYEEVPLLSECVYLGKSEENDVVLPGADVSRRHAMLCLEGGRWEIHDLESTNGTLVRGHSVDQAAVEPGESFRIGGFLLAIEGPHPAISREALAREAVRVLKRKGTYLPWSVQVVLLVLFLLTSVALVAALLFRLARH